MTPPLAFAPGAQLAAVPLFPLPDVTLFPGAVLPLHVFEPRYREMTETALASNRLICMVCLQPKRPETTDGHPGISSVAGLGEIFEHNRLADGRYHVLLRGRCRVNVKELAFQPPFRRGALSVLASYGAEPSPQERLALHAAIGARIRFLKTQRSDFEFEYPTQLPAGNLIDLCSQYLVSDTEDRQDLLEILDVGSRLHRCIAALQSTSAGDSTRLN